jgi:glycosyltransferase involved in cell wall biosynthesis
MPFFLAALLFFFIYCYFVIWWWSGIKKVQNNRLIPESRTEQNFSIIIAAHNEGKYIGSTLESLLRQNYPSEKYEIIVIADRCTDETIPIIQTFCSRFSGMSLLQVQQIPENYSPKKYALQQGIQAARFSHLILMDADIQTGPAYLQTLNDYFASGIEVLINIPKITPDESVLSAYLLPERLLAWSIAAAAVGHQKAFLAFGTTWGYTRRAYDLAGGLAPLSQSLSGDDDLLLARMQQAGLPTGICLRPAGWGQTRIPASLREFIIQRRRHHSAGKYYAPAVKIGYFSFHLSNLFLWLLPLFYFPAAFLLVIKFLVDMLMLRKSSRIFVGSLSVNHFFIFEIGYLLHHLLIAPLSFVGKIKWR